MREHGLVRIGLVLAAAATLAACAAEPQYPVRPGEPRAQWDAPKPAYPVTESEPSATAPPAARPAPAPVSPVDDSYIRPQPIPNAPPPPDGAGPPLRGRQSPGPPMAVRAAPPPALETPREVTVRPGESLFEVAERVRTPIRAIIDLNGLEPPYDVAPGTVLRIPPPVVYTVRPGDTLMSVGRRFSIDPRSLANLNDLGLETALRPGQRLALPALAKDSQAPRPASAAVAPPVHPPLSGYPTPWPKPPAATAAQAVPPSARPPSAAPSVQSTGPSSGVSPPEAEAPSAAAVAAAGKGKFAWPVKGEILSAFGPKGPGQRNDGVNIGAEAGDTVRAAAAGQVVYAGNTIPGFGNLVVIKHPDGWTSLYGNLGKIAVKIRADVSQGQALGVAGLSGAVDRPQVHFEVRYAATPQEKARPVDPQSLLPQ